MFSPWKTCKLNERNRSRLGERDCICQCIWDPETEPSVVHGYCSSRSLQEISKDRAKFILLAKSFSMSNHSPLRGTIKSLIKSQLITHLSVALTSLWHTDWPPESTSTTFLNWWLRPFLWGADVCFRPFSRVCDMKELSIHQCRLFPSRVMAPGCYLAKQHCCAFLAQRILKQPFQKEIVDLGLFNRIINSTGKEPDTSLDSDSGSLSELKCCLLRRPQRWATELEKATLCLLSPAAYGLCLVGG